MTNVSPITPDTFPYQPEMFDPDTVGKLTLNANRVKYLRICQGWTQEDFAKNTQLSLSTISDLERGANNGSPRTWKRLADALVVPVAILFGTGPLNVNTGREHPSLKGIA